MKPDAAFKFDPPAGLKDFCKQPELFYDWHRAVDFWFEAAIDSVRSALAHTKKPAHVQFYNPAHYKLKTTPCEQTIVWNAFPKDLLRQFSWVTALEKADQLEFLSKYYVNDRGTVLDNYLYRPQIEYCEWHVIHDRASGKIRKVTFISEPPEYWFALFGGHIPNDSSGVTFRGKPRLVLDLYRKLVSKNVQMDDLIAKEDIFSKSAKLLAQKGGYNPYNKWNTTHGIVHLINPANALRAEIILAANATVLRQDSGGQLIVRPEELICCAGFGNPNLNSDPTIGATVNAIARLGAKVSLADPVGLYMDHIDLAGWKAPDGKTVADCVKLVRGTAGMMERIEVEVPRNRGFMLGDIQIAGVPVRFGGQIAECITVKLTGVGGEIDSIHNAPLPCRYRCGIRDKSPLLLVGGQPMHRVRKGLVPALVTGTAQGLPTAPPSRVPILHPSRRPIAKGTKF